MEIVNGKALRLRVKNPARVTAAVRKSKVLGPHEVLVHWGLQEAATLRKLGIDAPSPIEQRYDWPGLHKPMAHQKVTASFLTMHERAFVLSDPGTGKTASAIWAADYLMRLGLVQRVLVVCPVSIMDAAWRADLFTFAMHRRCDIAHGDAKKRKRIIANDAEFVVINFDGLEVVQRDLAAGGFDLIIVDECFVAGTPVLTPLGPKPIETLAAGDKVYTSNGVQRIRTTSARVSSDIVEVRLANGDRFKCTGDHPFFTDAGWVCARNLAGRRVVTSASLSDMRGMLRGGSSEVGMAPPPRYEQVCDLLEILRTEEIPCDEPGDILFPEDATRAAGHVCRDCPQPSAAGGNLSTAEGNGPQAQGAWRERGRNDPRRSGGTRGTAGQLGMELPRSVGEEAARLSYLLQARLREPDVSDWAGGGRTEPRRESTKSTRREENGEAGGVRVDSVSHIECGRGTTVYNIEVEGTPNYFVGSGCLVHNCTAYKNPTTKRWKVLHALLRPDTRLWLMTGTPAAQGPEDAYGLAKLVNPDGVPRFKAAFRDMVMTKVSQFRWVPKPDATETVHRVLQPAIRFAKEDCLDLPDILYTRREVEMTKQQAKYYHTLRQQMLFEADGERVTAANAAVLLNKLLQVSCGAIYSESGDALRFDISSRYKVLKEVIDETTRKVLVFVPYRHSMEMLQEALTNDGYAVGVISGAVSAGERAKLFQDFQTAQNPRILLIQPQAAAHGVTLTAADTVVWWSPTPSLETYVQANARIHRKGQTHKCTVVQLYSSPAERRIYGMLDDKIDVHTKLVDLYRQIL